MRSTRRAFLASAAAASAAAAPARPPNILFCISDDQSWLHAGAYGSRFVRTPAFDRLAREGVLFRNAFVSTPSCAPSRASVLTGQDFYRLREASMNHTEWMKGAECYPDALAARGWRIGFTGKPWGPGNWKAAGRKTNPCGSDFNRLRLVPPGTAVSDIDYAANFAAFLESGDKSAPFCFWAGFIEPHRVFQEGQGERRGVRLADVEVPPFLPDTPEVRRDLADYADEIAWYDGHLARMLETLEGSGQLDNTIVVCTSDNGMAFPRAKGNLYEYGVHMPLAIRWGARVKGGRTVDDFVSFTDFAPTFLEAAGAPPLPHATGRSLLPLLLSGRSGRTGLGRDCAVFGIERHFPGSRPNGAGYPSRAIRTHEHLYIRNLTPDRNPVGDRPGPVWPSDDPTGGFGDTDGGLSKTYLWRERAKHAEFAKLAFDKRPAEELYAVARDPGCLRNLAGTKEAAAPQRDLAARLEDHRKRTTDPRSFGRGDELDVVMRRFPSLTAEVNRAQEGRR